MAKFISLKARRSYLRRSRASSAAAANNAERRGGYAGLRDSNK
jgi:hypothetical protein